MNKQNLAPSCSPVLACLRLSTSLVPPVYFLAALLLPEVTYIFMFSNLQASSCPSDSLVSACNNSPFAKTANLHIWNKIVCHCENSRMQHLDPCLGARGTRPDNLLKRDNDSIHPVLISDFESKWPLGLLKCSSKL